MKRAVLILIALAYAACSTTITTTKVTSANDAEVKGIRYSLPKPFVLATPDNEVVGGFKIEVVYLPDTEQTYAIAAGSKLGSYTFNAKVKDGLLQKITLIKGGAETAAEAARVAGELVKGELTRRETERKEEEEEAAKLEFKKDELEAAVATAKDDVAKAEAALQSWLTLEADFTGGLEATRLQIALGVRTARATLADAQVKLAAAEAKLADFVSENAGNFNRVTDSAQNAVAGAERQVYGPVLYSIVDNCPALTCAPGTGTVDLRAVAWGVNGPVQKEFMVVSPKPKPPDKLSLQSPLPGVVQIFDFKGDNEETIALVFSREIGKICRDESTFKKDADPRSPLSNLTSDLSQGDSKAKWTITLHRDKVGNGRYSLGIVVAMDENCSGDTSEFEVEFEAVDAS